MKPLETGQPEIRGDAFAKASGSEKYAADYFPEKMIWAGAVRAGIPHGRLLSVDCTAALAVPGVVKVLTSKDVPGTNRYGIIHKDTPVLAGDRIRYTGEAVALVLAETAESLRRAIDLVKCTIEPLPAVFEPKDALAEGAVQLHETHPGNILMKASIKKGDAIAAMSECDVVVSGEFSTPVQAHAFLETENGTARLDPDGGITMNVSTQAPFRDRMEIGSALGIPFQMIRLVSPALGGGFGGKDGATVQCLLALAALHAEGRSVKMVWSREENMAAGYKRHACKLSYTLGADRDGTLRALHCHLVYDTGAYAHLGGEVMELGMEHAGGPYRIPDTLIEGTSVFTNNPVAGAMRAFGVCQATFAFESMIDMLAEKIGMDPLELRLHNALKEGDINCSGTRLTTSTGIIGCLEIIQAHSFWKERKEWVSQGPAGVFRGLGLAALFNATGYGGKVRDSAIAKVELSAEGEIIVHNSVSDMGQGNSSAFVQMAGHILGQDASRLHLRQPDTTTAYPAGSSSASRTTTTFGNALIKACEALKSKLINRAGLLLYTSSDDELRLVPGKVIHATDGREVTLKALAAFMPYEDRVCISHFVTPVDAENSATATGFYIGFPHLIFTYGTHLARIEVERATGVIRVCDYVAATDGGSVINPVMFNQQIHGGVAQGIGYGLMEDVVMKNGCVASNDFATYLIPGAQDIPDIHSYALQGYEENGPYGIKGVGEIAMNGPLPAIANALADACDLRIFHAPLTPERVLDAIEGKL